MSDDPTLSTSLGAAGEDDGATVLNPVVPSPAPSPTPAPDADATFLAPPGGVAADGDATFLAPPGGVDADATQLSPPSHDPEATQLSGEDQATALASEREEEEPKPVMRSFNDSLPIGHTLMWYEIVQVLGQGGFGITYKARDPRLDIFMAVKEYLPSQLASRQADMSVHARNDESEEFFIRGRERFLNEARTLAKFKHPNLVRVVTFFEQNNTAYMAMEYEEGDSLASLLKEKGTLEENELLAVIMPLLQGLIVLHEADYIHRDIKPDNIFIRKKDGTPVLLDFGSARKAAGDEQGQMTTMLTPSFAPMEQYFNDAKRQGPWTDIYAMGAVMYRVISGKKPVDAPRRSHSLMANQPDPLVPAVEVGRDRYSQPLLQAIDNALIVIETQRPQTVKDWLRSVEITPPGQEEELAFEGAPAGKLESNRNRMMLVGLAALAVLGAGGYWWATGGGNQHVMTPQEKMAQEANLLQEKATAGDAGAQYQLGRNYLVGAGVPRNEGLAAKWFKEAATKGHGDAQVMLGIALSNGVGVAQNRSEAVRWLSQSPAIGKHAEGLHLLALALERGLGTPVDQAAALARMRQAAELGHTPSQYQLALWLARDKNVSESITWTMRAAEGGLPAAQHHLGGLLARGEGMSQDDDKALKWYRAAAQKGLDQAQYDLAMMLTRGKHLEEAADWLRKAAEQNHLPSQFQLALRFDHGEGVPPDPGQAHNWLTKAAEGGLLEAQLVLADKYFQGRGVRQDLGVAVQWFRKAAASGDAQAQNNLGLLHEQGQGVSRDPIAAHQWYSKAAEQGSAEAQANLGRLYEKGLGVRKDLARAREWYLKAAERGNVSAYLSLGWMYEDGLGVTANLIEAAKWYTLAAQAGDASARNNLGWMYSEGKGVPRDNIKALAWFTLAAAQNDAKAIKNMQLLSQEMNPEQVTMGQTLARKWAEEWSRNRKR